MSIQHTPGPWKLSAPGNKITGGGVTLAHVYGHTPETRRVTDRSATAEDAANARLIASAPELLSALKAIKARINGVWDDPDLMAFGPLSANGDDDILELTTAAIAKATNAS